MENQQFVSPLQQCSSTPVKDFLAKNSVTTLQDSLTWLQPIFTCSLHWNQNWRDGAFVMLLTSLRMRGRAEKSFINWLPGMFSTPLQTLAELYSCTRGLFWRNCTLNVYYVLCVLEKQWFREHFEVTMYVHQRGSHWVGLCEIWYLGFFVRKIQISLKMDTNRAFYLTIKARFIVANKTISPYKLSLWVKWYQEDRIAEQVQILRERATVLRHKCRACLVRIVLWFAGWQIR